MPGSATPGQQDEPKFIYETLKQKGFIVIVYNLDARRAGAHKRDLWDTVDGF